MERTIIGTSRVLAVISASAVAVLMLATTVDVIVRALTRSSVPGLLELAESSLIVAIFFGLAIAAVRGEHVAVTLLSDRLGSTVNRVFDLVVWGLASLFLAWLFVASVERAIDATGMREERFGLVRWPLWPLRWVIAIGVLAVLLVALLNVVRVVGRRAPLGAGSELELLEAQERQLEVEATGSIGTVRANLVDDGLADAPTGPSESTGVRA